MKPENPNPQAATPAAPGGLSTPAEIEQLADQLTAAANALHERIMKDLQAYHGGPVPLQAQEAARKLIDDEQELRQRANSLYADATTLIVRALGKPQAHLMALAADATARIKTLVKISDTMGVVGRLLEISGAALTGNPVLIMRSFEDMHHMLDLLALHNPAAATPAPSDPPAPAKP